MQKIRILIADDHPVVLTGVRHLLETHNWEVCGEALNGRQAVELAKQFKPDVVVSDIGMPELNGLEVTRQIVQALPRTKVIILSMIDSEQMARDVLEAGARGYVLKSDAGHQLPNAVNAVIEGRIFFSSKISEVVLQGYLRAIADESKRDERALTPREREVLQLLAEGKSSKEIASKLGSSPSTVETQRANIMRKLGLHSVAELVRYAIREHIADL